MKEKLHFTALLLGACASMASAQGGDVVADTGFVTDFVWSLAAILGLVLTLDWLERAPLPRIALHGGGVLAAGSLLWTAGL